MGLQWLLNGSGPLGAGAVEATLFAKSHPSEPEPDLQVQVMNFSTSNIRGGFDRWPGFTCMVSLCKPKSCGEIRLADAAGRQTPRIFANYLTHEDDCRIMLAGFRLGRHIFASEPLKSLIVEEKSPGPGVQSDGEALAHIRSTASSVFHPCGTCRMGEDEFAVVDSTLGLRGLNGLSIADASVMPQIVSPNIQPAVIMIAEKGADHIAKRIR